MPAQHNDPQILDDATDGTTDAVLVAYLRGAADPAGYWPNADRDAFAVALGQAALANDLVDDDQDGEQAEPHRSLVAYLDGLSFERI